MGREYEIKMKLKVIFSPFVPHRKEVRRIFLVYFSPKLLLCVLGWWGVFFWFLFFALLFKLI